jgi:hypothetical protein
MVRQKTQNPAHGRVFFKSQLYFQNSKSRGVLFSFPQEYIQHAIKELWLIVAFLQDYSLDTNIGLWNYLACDRAASAI